MWRRRQFYLEQAAPHAQMEAFYSDLALDLAGVERQPPFRIVSALTPDGKGLQFVTHGPSPRIYYPLGTTNLADDATVTRLIAMCKKEAAKEGAISARTSEWLRALVTLQPPAVFRLSASLDLSLQ